MVLPHASSRNKKRSRNTNNNNNDTNSHNDLNPLAQARTQRKNNNKNKRTAAEDLWARKTGRGFDWFVEYYTHQPVGTVSSESFLSEFKLTAAAGYCDDDATTVAPNTKGGGGQSRAARRRAAKKQRPTPSSAHSNNKDDKIIAPLPLPLPLPPIQSLQSQSSPPHPLWHAVQKRYPAHASAAVGQWQFFQTLTRPLPVTVRIRRTAPLSLVEEFRRELAQIQSSLENNDSNTPAQLQPTSWFRTHSPKEEDATVGCYQASCSKAALSRPMKDLLLQYSQNGVLARQELGSMLPVTLLDRVVVDVNKSSSSWLDLCASPGSKTLQAWEVLQSHGNRRKSKSKSNRLVANDIHPGRLQALQQAVVRSGVIPPPELQHDTTTIQYTCQDAAQFFMSCTQSQLQLFHAILCDVPCSGDGTVRKDPHVLPHWTPATARALHTTQVAILTRAVSLLSLNGGVCCYSTCSLNPIENEAVVAAVLQQFNDYSTPMPAPKQQDPRPPPKKFRLELMEWPDISGVILRPGISHWYVADHESPQDDTKDKNDDDDDTPSRLTWYDSLDQLMAGRQTKKNDWPSSLWPPTCAVAQQMHLSRCRRLWPQDQDSGGFFLALLRRVPLDHNDSAAVNNTTTPG